jgi:polyhydroxyalkanoate synthesis regulator phasin
VRERGRHSSEQVKEQVLDRAEEVLDVVPKYPQEEHVSDDVQPARVEKGRDQYRDEKCGEATIRDAHWLTEPQIDRAGARLVELAGDGRAFEEVEVAAHSLAEARGSKKGDYVCGYETDGNDGKTPRWIGVGDGNQRQHCPSIGSLGTYPVREEGVIDEVRRLALFTSGVAELTRNRAEQLVRDLVKSGEVRKDQASTLVKTLLDFSKVNRVEFVGAIRDEIKNQINRAGFVTRGDIDRLERRIARLEARSKNTTVRAGRPPRKSTVKTTARKPSSKRTTGSGGGPDSTSSQG